MMDNSDSQQSGLIDTVKDATLKYSGYAYIVGDAALFAHGMLHKQPSRAFTGLSWGSGGLALAIYGKQSPEYQLKRLSQELGQHLQQQGITLPPESELSRETLRASGTLQQLEHFMYDHPSQILNTVYAAGGATLIKAGMKKRDPWEAASGLLVTAGALGGLFIPEKEKHNDDEPEQEKANPLTDPVSWFREKPLRFSSLMYNLNNVTMFKSGYDEMRSAPANKSYMLKYLTVASYLLANSLLSMSHKDRDNEESDVPLEPLERAAAEVIAAQPPETQQAVLREVARFLSQQKQIAIPETEFAVALEKKVAELSRPASVHAAHYEGRVDAEQKSHILPA